MLTRIIHCSSPSRVTLSLTCQSFESGRVWSSRVDSENLPLLAQPRDPLADLPEFLGDGVVASVRRLVRQPTLGEVPPRHAVERLRDGAVDRRLGPVTRVLHQTRTFLSIFIIIFFNFFLKLPSKFIRILRITFYYTQLCGRCLVHMTPVVKVVIHCVFALL